jgi:Lantibiotic biosynthesis dehydratase C-term
MIRHGEIRSDWLYYLLYPGHPAKLDRTLAAVVAPVVAVAGPGGYRWFFLRYTDPLGAHIRLRFGGGCAEIDRIYRAVNRMARTAIAEVAREPAPQNRWSTPPSPTRSCVLVEIVGLVGICSDPGHIVAYTDGQIRQEYEVTLLARPVNGTPAANDEASEAGWLPPDRLTELDIHPTMRRQINDYLTNQAPHIDWPPHART